MAPAPMAPADARAWLERWKEVERVTLAEARALTPDAKLRQLESLRQSADLFEWAATEEEDRRVRELWARLHGLRR